LWREVCLIHLRRRPAKKRRGKSPAWIKGRCRCDSGFVQLYLEYFVHEEKDVERVRGRVSRLQRHLAVDRVNIRAGAGATSNGIVSALDTSRVAHASVARERYHHIPSGIIFVEGQHGDGTVGAVFNLGLGRRPQGHVNHVGSETDFDFTGANQFLLLGSKRGKGGGFFLDAGGNTAGGFAAGQQHNREERG